MPASPRPHDSNVGVLAVVLGIAAIAAYAVLGGEGRGPGGVPAERVLLAALLVVSGVVLRAGRAPAWGIYAAAFLAALIGFDLLTLVF